MTISRRRAIGLGAAAATGAVVTHLGDSAWARAHELDPAPFYGSPPSAIHPDRTPPSAGAATVVWSGPPDSRRVALTFDDGPHPDWTPRVLSALDRADVPATFFCTGRNVRDHGQLHRDSVGRHELGNHTFDHPDLSRLGLDGARDQLRRTSELMAQTYGAAPTLFRPPYGHLGGSTLLAAAEAGLTMVLWSAQAREDLPSAPPDSVVDDLVAQVRPGSILLAHDTGDPSRLRTIDHLDRLIERLRDAGYSFVTVSDVLGAERARS